MRLEAALGKPALHGHLTALKADLVVTACAGFLTLVAAASGFTQAGADATAYAALVMLGAICWLDAVEFHHQSLKAL
jgi:hypothetical protein